MPQRVTPRERTCFHLKRIGEPETLGDFHILFNFLKHLLARFCFFFYEFFFFFPFELRRRLQLC